MKKQRPTIIVLLFCALMSHSLWAAPSDIAVIAYKTKDSRGHLQTVTVMDVPKRLETSLFNAMIGARMADVPGTEPLIIIHSGRTPEIEELILQLHQSDERPIFLIDVEKTAESPSPEAIDRDPIDFPGMMELEVSRELSGWTQENIDKAATVVTLSSFATFGAMFFITSDVNSALAASVVAGILQVFHGKFNYYFLTYLQWTGRLTGQVAKALLPPQSRFQSGGQFLGQIMGSFAFNLVTSSAFVGIGSPQLALENPTNFALIALTAAAFGVYAESTVDLVFLSWRKWLADQKSSGQISDQELTKTIQVINLMKRKLSAFVGPLMFFSRTQPLGKLFLGTIGTVGLVGNFFPQKALRSAHFLVSWMERSQFFNGVFGHIGSLFRLRTSAGYPDASVPERHRLAIQEVLVQLNRPSLAEEGQCADALNLMASAPDK